jgi:class 3 adenylate cyclase/CHASE2 domain-containing sensor protein
MARNGKQAAARVVSESSERRRRALKRTLVWLGSVGIGLLAFGIAWGVQHVANLGRLHGYLALSNSIYDRAMTMRALRRASDRSKSLPVAVAPIRESTYDMEKVDTVQHPDFLPGWKGDRVVSFGSHERAFHARVINVLKKLGARVVVFDIVFKEEKDDLDPILARAIKDHGNVVLAAIDEQAMLKGGLAEQTIKLGVPNADVRAGARAIGLANVTTDVADRTVRVFQWWAKGIDEDTAEDVPYPALGVAAAAAYEGVDSRAAIHGDLMQRDTFLNKPVAWLNKGSRSCYIQFYGPQGSPAGSNSEVPYEDIALYGIREGTEYIAPLVRDKVILIGEAAILSQDRHRVPVTTTTQSMGESNQIPGVEIQAAITETVLSGEYVRRAPEWMAVLLLMGVCLASALLGRVLMPQVFGLLVALGMLGLVWLGYSLVLNQGMVLDTVTPMLGLATGAGLEIGFTYLMERKERIKVRRQLARHVGSGAAEALAEDEWPDLSGENAPITMLFSDLQGFTSISEMMTSYELCQLLNRYFGVIFPILDKYGGTVDKLMGDGMMAYFGWPRRHADHAARAVKCAIEIQQAMADWLALSENKHLPLLRTRVGIHTGEVTIGEIGSGERAEFTVIGDVVNVSSRLEGMNKEYGTLILISENTRNDAGDVGVPMTYRGSATVRGRKEPMPVYSVDVSEPVPVPPKGEAKAEPATL